MHIQILTKLLNRNIHNPLNILLIPLIAFLITFLSCNGQSFKVPGAQPSETQIKQFGDTASALGKKIDCMLEDSKGNLWFASNGEGVYRYDGSTLFHLTSKHGLCSDFVWNIKEDMNGHIWFTTRDCFCRYDGKSLKNFTETINNAPKGTLHVAKNALFFGHSEGVCSYDGHSFIGFTIHPDEYTPPIHSQNRPYEIYCSLTSANGNVYFGTQEKGVCVYDGSAFSYIDGQYLDGRAVRAIYQDSKGILWFGNNGGGLYRYDGISLRNITEENKLGNAEFLFNKKPVDKPGSLARVFAINEDSEGYLWIGTVDAGLWKYDGTTLTNYTTSNGLSSNNVYGIFKDRAGKLFYVCNGEAIFQFDGQRFVPFVLTK
jgi:ligand-binding sensor domain-containing protein